MEIPQQTDPFVSILNCPLVPIESDCRPLEKCEGLQNDVLQYLDFQLIVVAPSAGLA